jgi:hypothetical protein
MSFLVGPYPLELADVLGSTRRAVDRWRVTPAGPSGDLKPGRPPGLYLMVDEGAIFGVWLTFGPTWMDRGDPGEAKDPPYADEVFTAFTEAIWWNRFDVSPVSVGQEGRTWTPLLVLEWPAQLAARSPLQIPGEAVSERVQPPPSEAEGEVEERGFWLDDALLKEQVEEAATAVVVEAGQSERTMLANERSALCVVRGKLSTGSGRHRGTFALVTPLQGEQLFGLTVWRDLARMEPVEPESQDTPRLGVPLSLPRDGVGFPMLGWLDRRLRLRPIRPDDILTGTIHDRDVGGLLYRRLMEAMRVGLGVLAAVVLFALLIWKISEPRSTSFLPPADPEPPPALSLCSVDNARFLRELRCQVAAMSVAVEPYAPVCGDHRVAGQTSAFAESDTPDDVQPLWCGLRDREMDQNWVPGTQVGWADLAAARACFNVLGYPDTYARSTDRVGVYQPDVTAFFDQRQLQIQSLISLVGGLDEGCVEAGRRALRQVEGAILSTHVGDDSSAPNPETGAPTDGGSEAGRLREFVGKVAGRSLGLVERRCLFHGLRFGVDEPRHYSELCGNGSRLPPANAAWSALGPSHSLDAGAAAVPEDEDALDMTVFDRYTATRFFTGEEASVDALAKAIAPADHPWRCHVMLSGPPDLGKLERRGQEPPVWDIPVPMPTTYLRSGDGPIQAQLQLDSVMRWLRDRGDGGACWSTVLQRLGEYNPIHPLRPARTFEPWPSTEQQICGQVCAAWFRLEALDPQQEWVTPSSDLSMCIDTGDIEPKDGEGLDRLRLPWNDDRDGLWVGPSAAEICGFNLLAQGWFTERGVELPIDGVEAPRWAGETQPGSLIAGGMGDGDLAAQAALSMDSYGGERSATTCGHVAAQCVSTVVLQSIAENPSRPFNWTPIFRRRIAELAQNSGPVGGEQIVEWTPWCRLTRPYLPRDDRSADGRIDFPCANAVERTVGAGFALIDVLASGSAMDVEEAP